jgi:hypothetical protein
LNALAGVLREGTENADAFFKIAKMFSAREDPSDALD